jgi:spore maturation protein CgeB
MDEEFDGGVVSVTSAGELRWAIHDHLADPDRRRELAERGRRAVLERHTFAHRIETILTDLAADLATAPTVSRTIEPHAGNA